MACSGIHLRLLGLSDVHGPGNRPKWKRHSSFCHPDRSEAQWRDLQFSGHLVEMFFTLCRPSPERPLDPVEKTFPREAC
jgi:hypothetical protein